MASKKNRQSVNLADMAKAAQSEVEASKQDLDQSPPDNTSRVDLTPREIVFSLEYDAPTGDDRKAEVKSRILDADGRIAKTRVLHNLTRGMNPDYLSQEDRWRLESLARCSVQIIDPPEWLFQAVGEDAELLAEVVNVLIQHENRYFRGNARQSEGDTVTPRVRCRVPAFDEPSPTVED
jgi:hypothetical protein